VVVEVLLPGFGSFVAVLTFAVFAIDVFCPTLPPTRTTRVNVWAPLPAARLVRVAVTVPVPPAGGVVTVQPAGAVNDTNVVLVGMTSLSATVTASLGPAVCTVIV
jgi:hypothetical protein